MKYFLMMLLLFTTTIAFAEIFKSVDQSGDVTYSDAPTDKKAEIVNLPANPSSNSSSNEKSDHRDVTTTTDSSPTESQPQSNRKPYTAFSIQSPTDQETFQNQPIIKVDMTIQPKLQENDVIQLYVDNVPYGQSAASTQFELTTIDRGTHQISAELFDGNKNSLRRTAPITIYVHRASLGAANNIAK